MITDTHTHLYSEQFNDDRNAMIQRAKDAGVSRFFIPAIDSAYTESMLSLEKENPNDVFLVMGLHPTSVKENYLEELAHVKEWIDKRDFYAIGEIGIDLYWDKSYYLRGIFHCFTGTLSQAKQAISYNMKLGIGGVATFKNGKIDQFLNEIDIKHIVLETDAPYLAPTPFRGKRNESSYITKVIDKLVDIYKLSFDEIAEITTQNSKDVFGI